MFTNQSLMTNNMKSFTSFIAPGWWMRIKLKELDKHALFPLQCFTYYRYYYFKNRSFVHYGDHFPEDTHLWPNATWLHWWFQCADGFAEARYRLAFKDGWVDVGQFTLATIALFIHLFLAFIPVHTAVCGWISCVAEYDLFLINISFSKVGSISSH